MLGHLVQQQARRFLEQRLELASRLEDLARTFVTVVFVLVGEGDVCEGRVQEGADL